MTERKNRQTLQEHSGSLCTSKCLYPTLAAPRRTKPAEALVDPIHEAIDESQGIFCPLLYNPLWEADREEILLSFCIELSHNRHHRRPRRPCCTDCDRERNPQTPLRGRKLHMRFRRRQQALSWLPCPKGKPNERPGKIKRTIGRIINPAPEAACVE